MQSVADRLVLNLRPNCPVISWVACLTFYGTTQVFDLYAYKANDQITRV